MLALGTGLRENSAEVPMLYHFELGNEPHGEVLAQVVMVSEFLEVVQVHTEYLVQCEVIAFDDTLHHRIPAFLERPAALPLRMIRTPLATPEPKA